MIQALLPTDSEAPKLQKKEDKKDAAKKEEAKVRRFVFLVFFPSLRCLFRKMNPIPIIP